MTVGETSGLGHRAGELTELMDDPGCDPVRLANTYRHFGTVNALVAGWRRTYRRRIRPLLHPERPTEVLDVGCGGGDLAVALRTWARRDGLALRVTGIDPDARALEFAAARPPLDGVRFRRAATGELASAGERADIVISNHVLHHLDAEALRALLEDSGRIARRAVLHADITRSRLGYLAFAAGTAPFFRDSFIREDGLRSIRRSYRPDELRGLLPPGWRVLPQSPFRYLLIGGTDG